MADKSYVSKINGYYVKDAEAHGRLDTVEQKLVEGVGKIDEIHVNNTKIPISTDGKKSVNIAVDGTYNASTNKVATVKTVTEKVDEAVQGIMGDGVSQAYDTFKEMQDYISTHGSEAVGMANNITKNSQGIDALETAMDNLALEETYTTDADGNGVLEFEVGAGGISTGSAKPQWVPLSFTSSDPNKYTASFTPGTYGTQLNLQGHKIATSGNGYDMGTLSVYVPGIMYAGSTFDRYPVSLKLFDISIADTKIADITISYNEGTNTMSVKAVMQGTGNMENSFAVLFNE